jgi:PRC-barrel domain
MTKIQEEEKMVKTLLLTVALSGLLISDSLSQSIGGGATSVSPKFVASQSADQLVFSKFKGVDVVGPNDESIGGVNDLLFDKSGQILGVVVGVGGFLGIGQKNVAMEMSAFQIVPANSGGASAPTSRSDDPTSIKLKVAWTKDQVQQAPDFQYYKPPSESASNGASPTTGLGGQRSSPMAPVSPPAKTQ